MFILSLPGNTRDVKKIQHTHDVGIKVIGNGHVNRLVHV